MIDALPSAVLTQVQAILAKDAEADRIALLWPDPLPPGERRHQASETRLRLVYCPSELAMRELLVTHTPGDERLVMLTPFDETRLSKDVLARLWGCEPKRISPWRTLEQLLRVRQIDPRLTAKSYRWIAEALIEGFERYRGRIQFGEVLDLDKAWRALALAWLDFKSDTLDLDALLEWSLGADAATAVAALPESLAGHLDDWLGPALGAPGCEQADLVLSLWREGHAGEMVAIGLVCSVLYRPGLKPDQALFQARGRLCERLLGGADITDTTLQDYGDATVAAITRHSNIGANRTLNGAFDQAEQILASLDMLSLADASDLLPAAFGQRLDRLARSLTAALYGKPIAPALDALAELRRHRLATVRGEQLATAALAVRACRWLRTEEGRPASLPDAVYDYVANGGYLDWARSRLWSGDAQESLSRVYAKLVSQLSARRERFNAHFAESLPMIARGDQVGPWIQPIERALDVLVAPLAKQQRVLILVLDGMSHAVYRELTQDVLRQGWVELLPVDQAGPCCLMAALPTVTQVSRYALLSGTLGEGVGADEKKAFAAHPALKRVATKQPPLLLHKADLQQAGSGGLAEGVREVIAGQDHKVVGAVINAVDDHLSSGAQVAVRWSVASIGLLRQILEAARESGRLVMLTSDHGHVLDHDMKLVKRTGEAQRFKPVTEPVGKGELRVSGERVVAPGHAIVLPWSERIRYAAAKMGYHGGGSPQEVLVPFGVYRNAGDSGELTGWREVARQTPEWWDLAVDAQPATCVEQELVGWAKRSVPKVPNAAESPPQPGKSPKRDAHTLDLFAQLAEQAPAEHEEGDWIAALLRSPVYAQMKARSGRVRVSESQLRALLEELDAAGGQQMSATVAQRLGIPELRLNGFLAGVQKLLNVDGYPVLSIDRASKTVRLDRHSLKTQFEV
ncbi:BREX-2 system phosphatase PglZ [Thiorhodococcus mannitoliphagus]|uniref:BREX-2 system phosphatase PglZ n=1 Tax=Thiorhodococcus mannitoliphagus TaxID=329406 RepID=A0A6P1DXR0_9GAMM|nr:BREX-2 system phosphatase PglZ [Thiorhodococcus mannitoliphagus]NEX20415.1 BREX-2 system phosphatase PglZ [Thiorhodococcus mannitoliphagus]